MLKILLIVFIVMVLTALILAAIFGGIWDTVKRWAGKTWGD